MKRALVLLALGLVFVLVAGTAMAATAAGPYKQDIKLWIKSVTSAGGTSTFTIQWDGQGAAATVYQIQYTTGVDNVGIDDPAFWAGALSGTVASSGDPENAGHLEAGLGSLTNYRNYFIKLTNTLNADISYLRIYPPDKIPHGGYATETNLCLSCHQTHTAVGGRLLKAESIKALCLTCHEGSGSKYDVLNGQIRGAEGWGAISNTPNTSPESLAGAFGTAGNPPGTVTVSPNLKTITSAHTMDVAINQAPGGSTAYSGNLSCASCHNPHGTTNYRILRTYINDPAWNISVNARAVTSDPNTGKEAADYFGTYNTTNSPLNANPTSSITMLCRSCHRDFALSAGGGIVDSGYESNPSNFDAGNPFGATPNTLTGHTYRHAIGISVFSGRLADSSIEVAIPDATKITLPLENPNATMLATNNTTNNKIVCITCHVAHGTDRTGYNPVTNQSVTLAAYDPATFTRNIDYGVGGDMDVWDASNSPSGPWPKASTVLKRINNMGVCENCHQKGTKSRE